MLDGSAEKRAKQRKVDLANRGIGDCEVVEHAIVCFDLWTFSAFYGVRFITQLAHQRGDRGNRRRRVDLRREAASQRLPDPGHCDRQLLRPEMLRELGE